MLLSPEQLQEVLKIVETYHDAFIVNALGPEAVSKEVLEALQQKGLVDAEVRSVEDSYFYGQVLGILQSKVAASMSWPEFREYLKKNPVPLSQAEHQAVQFAVTQAAMYTKGLGNRVAAATGQLLVEADAKLRAKTEAVIRDATALNVARRKTVSELKTDLSQATKDWSRDWNRIAVTEKQSAMQRGVADHFRSRYGNDVLVAKIPMPDACFKAGTLVWTDDGEKAIEAIKPGDRVLTHRFRFKTVTSAFERHYSGKLYGFNGQEPCSTANHPYLAGMDWCRADSIQRGYNLIGVSIGVAKHNPTLGVEDIFLSNISRPYSAPSVPVSAIQLYRYLQARNSDINVEFVNSHFLNHIESRDQQCVGELDGIVGHTAKVLLPSNSFGSKCFRGVCEFMGLPGIFRKLFSFFSSHTLQPGLLALGFSWYGYPQLNEVPFYDPSAYFEYACERFQRMLSSIPKIYQADFVNLFPMIHGHTVYPHAEKVNTIATEHFNGTVYNLEVDNDESYVASGFVVHNCSHCKRLHLGHDGQPKIFKLSELEDNGTNVGRKAAEWRPVVGTIHSHCQCQMIRIPDGWGFNEDGQLVPSGKLGEHEDAEKSLRKVWAADDLKKAVGEITFQGLSVVIENPIGSERRWVDQDGEKGSTVFQHPYGYLDGYVGADNEDLDVFIGPEKDSDQVFVIEQQDPYAGTFDEHKVMLGFGTQAEAVLAYQQHYDRDDFVWSVNQMDMEAFKRWIVPTYPEKPTALVIPVDKSLSSAEAAAGTDPPAGYVGGNVDNILNHVKKVQPAQVDRETIPILEIPKVERPRVTQTRKDFDLGKIEVFPKTLPKEWIVGLNDEERKDLVKRWRAYWEKKTKQEVGLRNDAV